LKQQSDLNLRRSWRWSIVWAHWRKWPANKGVYCQKWRRRCLQWWQS